MAAHDAGLVIRVEVWHGDRLLVRVKATPERVEFVPVSPEAAQPAELPQAAAEPGRVEFALVPPEGKGAAATPRPRNGRLPLYLTPQAVAAVLQVSAVAVQEMCRNGKLPARRVGGSDRGQWRVHTRKFLKQYELTAEELWEQAGAHLRRLLDRAGG